MSEPAPRTGVMVIRVWTENGDAPLKVRITQTPDVEAPASSVRVAGSAQEIHQAVDAFLHDFLRRSGDGPVTRL